MKKQSKNWYAIQLVIYNPVAEPHTYGPEFYTFQKMETFFGTEEEILEKLFEILPENWKKLSKKFPKSLKIKLRTLEFLHPGFFDDIGFTIELHYLQEFPIGNNSERLAWKSAGILKKLISKLLVENRN